MFDDPEQHGWTSVVGFLVFSFLFPHTSLGKQYFMIIKTDNLPLKIIFLRAGPPLVVKDNLQLLTKQSQIC